MCNRNQSVKCYSSILTPPTKYCIVLPNFSPLYRYVITLLLLGSLTSPWSLCSEWRVMMKKLGKNRGFFVPLLLSAAILAQWWHPVASVVALNHPVSSDTCGIVPANCHGHQNGQQTGCIFSSSLFRLWLWRPLGQYGASSCPMAAFSGFRSSPRHPPLGNTACIASTPLHGYQNGLRQRHTCLSLSIFCMTLLVAKKHVMVH